MLSHALRRLVLLLLCLSIAPCVRGSERRVGSIGTDVQDASLIVIADTTIAPETYDTIVLIKEVLKGNQKWVGQTLIFPQPRSVTSRGSGLPRVAQDRVLLFAPAPPDSKDPFAVLETYTTPDVAAVKALISIYALPTERAQLVALRETWANDNKVLRAEFIRQVSQMREATNFELLLDFYPQADFDTQKKILDLLGHIGDARALPLLISVMENDQTDEKLRYSAAWQLNFYFPGAPGVTDAFRRVFPTATGNFQRMAAEYLDQREPDAKYQKAIPDPTLWMRANALLEKGDKAGARKIWWQVLATPDMSAYSLYSTAQLLLESATPADKVRLRTVLLPQLRHDVFEGDYLEAQYAAEILRVVAQNQDLDLLLALLNKSDFSSAPTRRMAMLSLREKGADAQHKAAAQLLENLRPASKNSSKSNVPRNEVFALAWLGNDDDWQQAKNFARDTFTGDWEFLDDLHRAAHAADEGAALAKLLADTRQPAFNAPEWILFRLDELADVRAVPALAQFLIEHPFQESATVIKILTRIGQQDAKSEAIVMEAATKLLDLPAENRARAYGVEIITAIQGTRALPLLRRLVREETNTNVKTGAVISLGVVGTPQDLPLLLPLADFWTAPRALQPVGVDAVRTLRRRFNLDVANVTSKTKA